MLNVPPDAPTPPARAISLASIFDPPKPPLSNVIWPPSLASSNVAMPADLQRALPLALEKVSQGVRSGMICLDYIPADARVVDIPVVSHPHYMQALMFWASRLDCTLERLVEAHARLGASPSIVNVSMVLAQIEREDAAPGTHFGSTMSAYQGQATMPVFANTRSNRSDH